jgi:hypothetical protein
VARARARALTRGADSASAARRLALRSRNDTRLNRRIAATLQAGHVSREATYCLWSGREDLNLDPFPGREPCYDYTTSATSVSYETDTFEVWTIGTAGANAEATVGKASSASRSARPCVGSAARELLGGKLDAMLSRIVA